MPHIDVFVPDAFISVLAESPAISVEVPGSFVSVVCDDLLESSYIEPTLVSWSVVAEDLGSSGARLSVVELVTAGSPCRVRLSLVHALNANARLTNFSSPEQLTPHSNIVMTIIADADRGLYYDLYWEWTSGNQSGGPDLAAEAAVYVPTRGEGNVPQESE